ncbi:MAG: hypothetical protein HYZ42_00845, partial [Bacteroidetes bacterium]|nr:hypothetical protein [Bacteroidota bacterium]
NYQNHYAQSSYYPFRYIKNELKDEVYSQENMYFVMKNNFNIVVTDSIIADSNFSLQCKTLINDGLKPFYLYKKIYAH